jgi:hypothetical protein
MPTEPPSKSANSGRPASTSSLPRSANSPKKLAPPGTWIHPPRWPSLWSRARLSAARGQGSGYNWKRRLVPLWPLLRAMQDENDVDSITTDGEIVSQGLLESVQPRRTASSSARCLASSSAAVGWYARVKCIRLTNPIWSAASDFAQLCG